MITWLVTSFASFLVAAAVFVVVGVLHDLSARRQARHRERIGKAVTAVLFGDDDEADQGARALMRLRRSALYDALQALSADLEGRALSRTRHLVDVLGLDTHIDHLSRGWRRSRRVRAAQLVSLVGGHENAADRLLTDPSSLVRALTIETLGASELARMPGAIERILEDPSHLVRVTGQDVLIRSGGGVVTRLGEAIGNEATRLAALTIAAHLTDPRMVPLALQCIDSPVVEERVLVARSLGNLAGPDASEHLARLLDDEDARVRATAARSIGTAGRGELAGRVGRALSDPSWDVRHAAGEALSRFGALGSMVLHAHLEDDDAYARDMASRFIDLIEESAGHWQRSGRVGFAPVGSAS